MISLLSVLACRSTTTTPDTDGVTPKVTHTGTPDTTHSGLPWTFAHSGHTGATGHTGDAGPDCDTLPAGPYEMHSTNVIRTEEDFDFDDDRYLLTQSGVSLAGVTRTGQTSILVSNIGVDAAGIRTLPSGDILIAQPDTGVVRRVDASTGGSVAILSSLLFPNGLEVSSDGRGFVSEFVATGRVREFNPITGNNRIILEIPYPNNMVLSPDEQVLYVLASTGQFGGTSRVMALDRVVDGWASQPREILSSPQFLGGIAVDVCGNLYVTEYSSGRVGRILMPEQRVEAIADLGLLGGFGYYSSARFSPGYGGWSATELYVTDRFELFTIDLGIEGRHVLK
ncbi:MAG: hypothetical protein KC621_23845 [Myxococcales bacterium]|nr:hypothetical protein [Myxococcales bacterium]